MLKRSVAAGVGLTVLSLSPAALAARKQALATPPSKGRGANSSEIVQRRRRKAT